MSGRPTREVALAVAYLQRTPGCTPQQAATKYGLGVSTVRRGLAKAGVPARPVGRPTSVPPAVSAL